MSGGWVVLGWVIVLGLPMAVVVVVICWPTGIPKDRTVRAIARRIEDDEESK